MKEEDFKYLLSDEVLVKICTYEGLYYTYNKHTKEEIIEKKKELEKENINYSYNEIIDDLIKEDLSNLIGNINPYELNVNASNGDLIYLFYENKIINRKEIKESLIQFLNK